MLDWLMVYLVVFLFVFLFQYMITFFDKPTRKEKMKEGENTEKKKE